MKYLPALLFILFLLPARAQEADTTLRLKEVEVTAYRSQRPLLLLPASVSVVSTGQMALQPGQTLVPVMNTVPGVRMEERSPGSYRLSIRGSLLRSPFGVRNVKVYIDEFVFTDAGGNTYLNLLDQGGMRGIEVVKGPEASLYGTNTGGVVLVKPYDANDTSSFDAVASGGSFGMLRGGFTAQKRIKNYLLNFSQGSQYSEGYRDHSAMQRNYAHAYQRWKYGKKNSLRLFTLYSILDYETPGGLTYEQWKSDPRAARPRKGMTPGAEEQNASVHNVTAFIGMAIESWLAPRLREESVVSFMSTSFENPFITNYEQRKEGTASVRALLELTERKEAQVRSNWKAGIDYQETMYDIANFENLNGLKGAKQSAAAINVESVFVFSQATINIRDKWNIEAAASNNQYRYKYRTKAPYTDTAYTPVALDKQLMPRLALSCSITKDLAWRASASRGYSPPSIAEIRPSSNLINSALQPEHGWNYETGFRFRTAHERLWIDAVFFYFSLDKAIVRRVDAQDEEYFVNAGGTRQPGLESQLYLWIIRPRETGIIRALQLTQSYTYHYFSFANYSVAGIDHSGNDVTGVARNIAVTGLELRIKGQAFAFVQHNYTSPIPLNDANTEYAADYHLVQAKAGWTFRRKDDKNLTVFAGADNLLDEMYSLGNDLNAFGGRYYNPAPGRNFYFGLKAML